MTTFVDGGYLSYHIANEPEYFFKPWELSDKLVNEGAIICIDSEQSIRQQKYPWYKANRGLALDADGEARRAQIRQWRRDCVVRYPDNCRAIEGLESDDLVGMYASPGDIIITEDRDSLQLKGVTRLDLDGKEWGINRQFKYSKALERSNQTPEAFLAYQLCTGCSTDCVPRLLYSKDRTTLKTVLSMEHPLQCLLGMVNVDMARERLDCLITPTPLHTGVDPILYCERYYNFKME